MSQLREQLLGYLLGALDEEEHVEVERKLASNPAVRTELEQLKAALTPLQCEPAEFEPPKNLADRTCDLVGDYRQSRDFSVTPAGRDSVSTCTSFTSHESVSPRRSSNWLDTVVTVGVCTTLAILFFPALLNSREGARRFACQNNLRQIGVAIAAYSQQHLSIPYIPLTGPFAFAGYYAPTLRDNLLLEKESQLLCPGSPDNALRQDFSVPTREMLAWASPDELCIYQARAGGSYGFHFGVVRGTRHCAPTLSALSYSIILADAPDYHRPNFVSSHHGGSGINVLYGDFRCRFVPRPTVPGRDGPDDIYLNHEQHIAAGLDETDSVIALSPIAPRVISASYSPNR